MYCDRIVRALAKCTGVLILILASSAGVAAPRYVISAPGNTPEWNKKLGVTELWVGCSSEPERCMKTLDYYARHDGVNQVTLSISEDAKLVAGYALSYSQASLAEPRLRAIVLDDFVSAELRWQNEGVAVGPLVQQVISNVKAKNPKLVFGLTVYEDQLRFPVLQDSVLPAAVRAQVDRVSLFVHFRQNGPQYASYVAETKRIFPKAIIIAGVYPYDRTAYLPCAPGTKEHCSHAQEMDLFQTTLRVEVGMVDSGQVAGIQFWPGNFGSEQAWSGWDSPGACEPSQHQECVNTTVAMHNAVEKALH